MKIRKIDVDRGVAFGDGSLTFIAGPCVIESRKMALDLAARLVEVANDLSVNYVFKASFDKANRTSVASFRDLESTRGWTFWLRSARSSRCRC